MTRDEEYYWFYKLYPSWQEYNIICSKHNITYYDRLRDKKFQLYLQQQYGIIITPTRKKNIKSSERWLGIEKVEIINPMKKLLLDIKFT